jgi:hypothetical protein
MGAWGVAIFSDDLAADIRIEFRELIGDGLTASEATARLQAEYASSLDDPDQMPVFWLALALTQWKLGRVEESVRRQAVRIIDDGIDLARWGDAKSRARRAAVLARARAELMSAPPPARRVPRTVREANTWQVGETIGFQLLSGRWTLLRVIGHHTDRGGRFAICELLDWVGAELPSGELALHDLIARLRTVRSESSVWLSQFLFEEPRRAKEKARIVRLGTSTPPQQKPRDFTVLAWSIVDRSFEQIFGVR